MIKNITIKNRDFKIKNDAYVLVIYQQLTGNDLMADLNKFGTGNISFKTLIDILFAFCFNADNTINYDQFYASIDLKLATCKEFIEKISNLIKDELIPEENKENNYSEKK